MGSSGPKPCSSRRAVGCPVRRSWARSKVETSPTGGVFAVPSLFNRNEPNARLVAPYGFEACEHVGDFVGVNDIAVASD